MQCAFLIHEASPRTQFGGSKVADRQWESDAPGTVVRLAPGTLAALLILSKARPVG